MTRDRNDRKKRGKRPPRPASAPPRPASAPSPVSVRESSGHLVPDRPTEHPPAPSRTLTIDDEDWIARVVGEGYGGTGRIAPTYLAAVQFFRADDSEMPLREALLPRGRLESMYVEELRDVFERADSIDDDGL